MEQKGKYFYENEHLQHSHETLESINCFSSIGVEYRSLFPVKIKTKPCIVLLRRKYEYVPPEPEILLIEAIDDKEIIDDNEIEILPESNEHPDLNVTNVIENNEDIFDNNISEEPLPEDVELNDSESDDENDIKEIEMKKPTIHMKAKIKKIIETHYRSQGTAIDTVDYIEPTTPHKRSAKSNIKHIIKSEQIKELVEKISQMDLKSECDLERESTKSCLIKIIDRYDLK